MGWDAGEKRDWEDHERERLKKQEEARWKRIGLEDKKRLNEITRDQADALKGLLKAATQYQGGKHKRLTNAATKYAQAMMVRP